MAQSEEHSPGKRKVPGSNPGRSLGHFFRSVISHSSLSLFQRPYTVVFAIDARERVKLKVLKNTIFSPQKSSYTVNKGEKKNGSIVLINVAACSLPQRFFKAIADILYIFLSWNCSSNAKLFWTLISCWSLLRIINFAHLCLVLDRLRVSWHSHLALLPMGQLVQRGWQRPAEICDVQKTTQWHHTKSHLPQYTCTVPLWWMQSMVHPVWWTRLHPACSYHYQYFHIS